MEAGITEVLLSIKAASIKLGIARSTVYYHIKVGRLRPVLVDGREYIRQQEIDHCVEKLKLKSPIVLKTP